MSNSHISETVASSSVATYGLDFQIRNKWSSLGFEHSFRKSEMPESFQ